MSDQLIETYYYLLIVGVVFVSLIILLEFLSLPFAIVLGWGGNSWFHLLKNVLLLLSVVFLFGGLVNLVWYSFVNEKLYIMADPLFHFSPFVPFGWWSLDQACGGLLQPGIKMWHLRALWAASALCTWMAAIVITPLF